MNTFKIIAILFLLFCSREECNIKSFSLTQTLQTNPKDCGIIDSNYNQKTAIKEHAELLQKIKQQLASANQKDWKYDIKQDTLQIAQKLKVNQKAEYNIYKLPIKKLANVTKGNNTLTVYTKWKAILINRYGYKKGVAGELSISPNLSKKEIQQLFSELQRLSQINCYLNTLE